MPLGLARAAGSWVAEGAGRFGKESLAEVTAAPRPLARVPSSAIRAREDAGADPEEDAGAGSGEDAGSAEQDRGLSVLLSSPGDSSSVGPARARCRRRTT